MVTRSGRRLLLAGTAVALAVVLVLPTGRGTMARWFDEQSAATGSITAGSVHLTAGTPQLQLHSRQPAGARTFASTQTCTPVTGATECRTVTATLPQERLIPGDRIQIRLTPTLTGAGENLSGTLTVDAADVVLTGTSALSAAATVQLTVTPPDSPALVSTGPAPVLQVPVGTADGVRSYPVLVDVVLPAAQSSGARWGQGLRAQTLNLDTLSVSFTQI